MAGEPRGGCGLLAVGVGAEDVCFTCGRGKEPLRPGPRLFAPWGVVHVVVVSVGRHLIDEVFLSPKEISQGGGTYLKSNTR